jgi:hypothetical protein
MVLLMTFVGGCAASSSNTGTSPRSAPTDPAAPPAGHCHASASGKVDTLKLSFHGRQRRIAARVGDVVRVSARWDAALSAPRPSPGTAACQVRASSGRHATAKFVLEKPGRLTFSTSDLVATAAMDPAFSARVLVKARH